MITSLEGTDIDTTLDFEVAEFLYLKTNGKGK
jgi:CMP-N-acetylneuraminic acid synthetase